MHLPRNIRLDYSMGFSYDMVGCIKLTILWLYCIVVWLTTERLFCCFCLVSRDKTVKFEGFMSGNSLIDVINSNSKNFCSG